MPDDPTLRAFYDSADYFQSGETASGYSDYDHQTENVLPFFRRLLEKVGLGNGRSVLDIGCAYGTHLALAAKSGWQCYGVEVSAHARRVMRERCGDTIPVVTHVIDLPVRTYDLILLFDVLEHLRDPYRLFLDLSKIDALGSHTKVVVTMPNARSAAALADPAAWVYRTPPEHLVYFSAESLALFFSALGFKRVDISGLSAVDHLGTADRMVTDSYVFFARYAGVSCEATEFHSPSSPLLQAVSVERERMRNDTHRLRESPYLDALFRLLGSEVTQRDQALAAHDRALAERDEQIATLNQAMAERDGQIASLNRAVAERDGQIANLDGQIANFNRAVAERDRQIANFNRAVAERDGQIDRLDRTVAQCDAQIGALRRHAAQLRTDAAATARQVHDLRHELDMVYTSSSWRLTGPLRASRRLLSHLLAGNRKAARSPTIGIPAVVGPLAGSVSDDVSTATPPVADRQRAVAGIPAVVGPLASSVSDDISTATRPVEDHQRAVDDFDRNFYLQVYPDIAASGIDPYQHYLNHGRKEGRLGRAPQLIANAEPQVLAPDRPTVLVVSHEASRTGAPILAWNICRELRHRCNVIALLLGGGGIASYFPEACDVVVGPFDRPIRNPMAVGPIVVGPIVNDICDRYSIDVALVNSIESRASIPPLAERFVPSVLLIHEFFGYVRPREDFVVAMRLAAAVVFPSRLAQRNALTERTRPAVEASHVLAQGKCVIPARASTGAAAIAELAKIETLAQPGGRRCFFVLGAGTVEYRKGVDLFVATAAEVRRLAPDADVAMLWIGHGFDPEKDLNYSAYVQEQIAVAGIDSVAIVDEIENLEPVYARADAFLLSSRLDPMPNVAIDAMSIGKPVICFDNATGIAEVLANHPSTAECILPSASIGDAARLILRLQSSPAFADAVSAGVRELAARYFHMPTYVARLFDIAWAARTHGLQERSDAATLQDAADFDVAFASTPVTYPRTREQAIVSFLRSSASGIDARRPAPGFDAATYARQHELGPDVANPFAHWLRAGRPDGPWCVEVIDPSKHTEAPVAIRLRRALHVHAFYIDLLDDIVARLGSEGPACDLFVSVVSDADAAQARRFFETYRRGACDVRVVPNCGLDIGPFLTTFGAKLQAYAVIGHVHTKCSAVHNDGEFAWRQRDYLLDNLLGRKHPAADVILGRLAEDPRLGIVYPDDPNLLDWGGNRDLADALARRMGIASLPDPPPSFPVGTMFWARPAALAPLFDLDLDWSDYPAEPLPYDGSMLHAIERLLPIVVSHTGYRRAAVHVPGSTR